MESKHIQADVPIQGRGLCTVCTEYCQATCTYQNVKRKFPICVWLPKYSLKDLQGDVIAGLTVGLTVIPQGLAYAQIASLPHQYGLYSAFMGCFIYCIFGSSKDITLGPTAIMSLMTAIFARAPKQDVGDATYAILLTLMCGLVQLALGVFQLGILVDFISFPVITGFTSAAAIVIAVGQVKYIFGLKGVPRDFIPQVINLFSRLPETNWPDLVMGSICIILLMILKKCKSINWRDEGYGIPTYQKIARKFVWLVGTARNAIIVIAASLVIFALLSQNINRLTITGKLKGGLPPFKLPDFVDHQGNITVSTDALFGRIGIGFAIVPMMGLVETIAIGKAFARQNNYRIDANQELIAIGVSNILGSFVGSYPVTGSFSRTAVNSQSGVRTPAGGIFTGSLVLLALGVLTPLFYYIPQSALAGVIIMAVLPMVEYKVPLHLWKVKKLDLLPYFATFLFSFILGVEYGILVGIGLSLIILLYPAARPKVMFLHREAVVVQVDQGLKFPGIENIKDLVYQQTELDDVHKSVILDCSNISGIDFSTVQGFEQLLEDFQRRNCMLLFANMQPCVLEVMLRADLDDFRHYSSIEVACAEVADSDNLSQSLLHQNNRRLPSV